MTEQAWTTTITKIDPIPGKDRIVLATVEGYQSIVAAGEYKVGDRVCYISEQTLVPLALQKELGLEGRLAGANKDRVKAIKMGGVLSQGIICHPTQWEFWVRQQDGGQLVPPLDEVLGVSRYQPSIPVHLSGKVARPKGNAPIVPMYDVENIKKQRHWTADSGNISDVTVDGWWVDPFVGEDVVVTEKLHGTNIGIHMNHGDDTVYVYSKGIGQNGHVLVEDENNTYWRAVRANPKLVEHMASLTKIFDAVTVFGEVVGRGIQDMNYGIQDIELFVFDIRIWDSGKAFHLTGLEVGNDAWKTVPVLYRGPYDHGLCVQLAQEPSAIGGGLREGVVVTLDTPDEHVSGGRQIAKFINPAYLTRKSGTEYQ